MEEVIAPNRILPRGWSPATVPWLDSLECLNQGCGIAFLGIAFSSYLLSHAYYVAPSAARMLLNITKEACNPRSQDYAMRDLCVHNQSAARLRLEASVAWI